MRYVHNIRANDHGSLTSFKLVIRVNGNITRKTIIRILYLRNEQEGIYYQRRLQHINPGHLIDIDEMAMPVEEKNVIRIK